MDYSRRTAKLAAARWLLIQEEVRRPHGSETGSRYRAGDRSCELLLRRTVEEESGERRGGARGSGIRDVISLGQDTIKA
jgi:hypothetical protein